MRTTRPATWKPGALLTALFVGGLALSGCASPVGESGDQGYVSGTGAVSILDEADRESPGEVAGKDLDGNPVDLAGLAGQVVVLPVWGSWCAPCRAEAPMLAAAARDLADRDVAFLGLNSRDADRAAPQAFVRRFDVPYPSIFDPDGVTLLAFRGTLTPNSIPSVVFVDAQGRVAASVIGEISRTTLYEIVDELTGAAS